MRILTFTTLLIIIASSTFLLQDVNWLEYSSVTTNEGKSFSSSASYNTSLSVIEEEAPTTDFSNNTSFSSMVDTVTFVMPVGTMDSLGYTLANCTDTHFFESDGDLVYFDGTDSIRNSIVTICPPNHGDKLLFTFSEFNLSTGDSLFVYEGIDTLDAIDTAGGAGVFQINGGWLASNCDPTINASGCITFNFKTNGDNLSGSGWKAQITCVEETIASFVKPGDVTRVADCSTLRADVTYSVPTLDVSQSGGCNVTDLRVIRSFCGKRDTVMAGEIITDNDLPYGVYPVDYRLLVDTTIHAHCFIYVTTPSLVCNDEINVSIGQGCKTEIAPDAILESFGTCEPFNDGTIEQFFIVHVETDTGLVSGTLSTTLDSLPVLNAGNDGNIQCNNTYNAFITRVITLDSLACTQSHRDSCQIKIKFVDGIRPVFLDAIQDTIQEVGTFFGCQDLEISPSQLTRPRVIDNCELASLEVEIPEIELDACDATKTFFAKWVAIDRCGETTFAYQALIVERPTADNLFAPKDTTIDCSMSADPSVTGWPILDSDGDGIPDLELQTDGGATCFLDATFREDTIPVCGTSFQIVRYWSLRNFCENEQSVAPADTQIIVVVDTVAPIMIKPLEGEIGSASNPHIFSNGHFGCTGILPLAEIPIPGGTDNCDGSFTTKLIGLFGTDGGVDYFPDREQELAIGSYSVAFAHIDACNNRSDTCHIYFDIRDQTSPTPICTDELRVSMTNGNFPIRPEDIDNGTTDNCGIDQFYIRRSVCGNTNVFESALNTEILATYEGRIPADGWAPFIEVGCCDINQLVRVQLLAIDKAGNFNVCWLNIFPEDHLQPICAALPDTVAYCDEYHTDVFGTQTDDNHNGQFDEEEWLDVDPVRGALFIEKFGNPVCKDNLECGEISIEQQFQLIVDQCGEQRLRRRYRSLDFSGSSPSSRWYEQNIHIQYRPGWTVTFPADTVFQCGSVVPDFPIEVFSGLCDLLKWEFKDEVFAGTGGGCFKVFRKWQLVNNCQLVNGQEAFPLPRDIGADGHVSHSANRTFSARDIMNGQLLGNYGLFTYTQIIKVQDSEAPIISISTDGECLTNGTTNCRAPKTFSLTAEDCTFNSDITFRYELLEGNTLVKEGTAATIDYNVSPFETYTVKVTAFDNCGNSSASEQIFRFMDCSIPVALCNGNNLNIDILASKEITVPATWLNGNSFDDCDPDLDFRIWHNTVTNTLPTTIESVLLLPNQITLGCNDRGQSEARLFVIDNNNNFSNCSTQITIQDNKQYCGSNKTASISGTVSTIDGDKVEGVEVRVARYNAPTIMEQTDTEGFYNFEIEEGSTYTLTPRKNTNLLNGVSTYDLVIVQRHILGIDLLDSPYKYIAADVNRSGTITAFDMVQLRKVILNIDEEFPNNWSWRFVSSSYPMDPNNPLEDYAEEHQLINAQDGANVNFVAVKIGDLNSSALTNDLMTAAPRSNKDPMSIQVADQVVKAGERYTVDFNINQLAIEGYQFTLTHQGLSLLEWVAGEVTPSYLGTIPTKEDYLTVSWNRPEHVTDISNTIFSLIFEAEEDGLLSEFLTLSDRPTVIEAYDDTNEPLDIKLAFEEISNNRPFEVYQNTPNPFTEQTVIGFYLPSPEPVSFTLLDVTGTIIYQSMNTYDKGENEILIDRKILPMNGVFYYHLETKNGMRTKSMLVIN